MNMLSPPFIWLIVGVVCVALEALGVSGVGFFFAGLAALCVGVLVELGLIGVDGTVMQLAAFFGLTAIWTFLLWAPLRKFRMNLGKKEHGYSNMIGDTAIVSGAGLKPGITGDVIWSGTVMKAELAPSAGEIEVAAGSQVVIVSVRGATLIVEPK